MASYEKRSLIEALRSGVPSRSVGKYFSSARRNILDKISQDLEDTISLGSRSFVISGKYGEGKTHLLNTVFSMAQEKNMVVSFVPLGKETPPNRIDVLYKRILQETYLPKRNNPGLQSVFSNFALGSEKANDMLLFAANKLKVNRLYYVLKTYLAAQSCPEDDVDILDADLRGSFASVSMIKELYAKYCSEKAVFNGRFTAKGNTIDYFSFMSHLFKVLGYSGWVILFDEAELIGRFSTVSRIQSYLNLSKFINAPSSLENVYSLFAFSSSFTEEVISGKDDYSAVEASVKITDNEKEAIKNVLDRIVSAQELQSLTQEELRASLSMIIDIYNDAYDVDFSDKKDEILSTASSVGYLLRTRIRAAIEALDQIYQNGSISTISSNTVDMVTFEETLDQILSEEE